MIADHREQDESTEVFFSQDFVRAVPWALLGKVILIAVQFGTSLLVVRKLGPSEFGMVKVCELLGTWVLVICGLGLNTAVARFAPELCVNRNRSGLLRLIGRTATLQIAMLFCATLLLLELKPQLDTWYFKAASGPLLVLTVLSFGMRLIRQLIEDVFTALYRMGTVSILSGLQGLLWFLILLFLFHFSNTAATAMTARAIAATLYVIVGIGFLLRLLRNIPWQSSTYGIGKRRVLFISMASMVDQMGGMFLQQYSEIFFLTIFFTPTLAGLYGLGCETPLMVISLIPMAVQRLFLAGFAEAFTKDRECLGRLISASYRALIAAVLPLSCFGVFFAPRGIELLYGMGMKDAGPIAAVFCVLHTISLVWVPLSMAIITREKVYSMFALTLLQVAINIVLDLILIPQWGMSGAVAAVFLTFLIGGPIQMYFVIRIVGRFSFPSKFLARYTIPHLLLAGVMSPLAPHLDLPSLTAVSALYLALVPFMIRGLKLIHEEDVTELRSLGLRRVNCLLDWIVLQKP